MRKKLLAKIALTIVMSTVLGITVYAKVLEYKYATPANAVTSPDQLLSLESTGKWVCDDKGWKYLDEKGKPLRDCWLKDIDGRWYCFDEDGHMLKETWTKDHFYVDKSGAYVPGYREYVKKDSGGPNAGNKLSKGMKDNKQEKPKKDVVNIINDLK